MPGRHDTFRALLVAGLVIAGTAVGGQRHPDLQGYWTNDSYVPLERPDEAKGKEFFTPAEAQAFLKSRVDRLNAQSRTDIHYDDALWQAENYVKQAQMRTSIIYDPPDGRLPPLSDAGRQLEAS